LINRRYDYKAGVLPGLGLATLAFIVPAICLALVACYALFDLRTARHGGALASEGAGL
jgi:hypothetical protein